VPATNDALDDPAQSTIENEIGPVPIVHQIFGAFTDKFSTTPERTAVANRLRKALIVDGARTEAALRAALFEGGDA
jgi:hypothetical protein